MPAGNMPGLPFLPPSFGVKPKKIIVVEKNVRKADSLKFIFGPSA